MKCDVWYKSSENVKCVIKISVIVITYFKLTNIIVEVVRAWDK